MTGAWHVYREGEALARASPRSAWLTLSGERARAPCSSAGRCSSCSIARASPSTPRCARSGPTCSTTTRRSPWPSGARARARTRRAGDRRGAARPDRGRRHRQRRALRGAVRAAHRPVGAARRHLRRDADRAVRAFAARPPGAACATAGALPKVVYGAKRCRRCGGAVRRRGQGDEARTVHWCPAVPGNLQVSPI